ncbi:hypothetical protein AN958_02737 [Leucoagaricus sp. SymC.cos]|nr:hypothetical protein AN958_02737 [Leucoagaricus sp. SymC.cos]
MDDLLDELDLFSNHGTLVNIPFAGTARYEGHKHLALGLEKHEVLRPLLKPILHNDYENWNSDETDSGDELMPDRFDCFDAVGPAFGPGGGDIECKYQVNKELATKPALQEMIVKTEHGVEILRIRPKCQPRRRVTRGCVELTLSEWMRDQRSLPPNDPRRHNVQWTTQAVNVDGAAAQVPVWLWRGLEQDPKNPNIWIVYL